MSQKCLHQTDDKHCQNSEFQMPATEFQMTATASKLLLANRHWAIQKLPVFDDFKNWPMKTEFACVEISL